MSDLIETTNLRIVSPRIFRGRYRHPCLRGCGNVMIVPDPNTPGAPEQLEEGQIWACGQCRALHEYYLAYGSASRNAGVRLLHGDGNRQAGEPLITEFLPHG